MTTSTDPYSSCYLYQSNLLGGQSYHSEHNRKGIVAEYFFLLLIFLIFKILKQTLLKKKEDKEKEIEKISVTKMKKALQNSENFDQKFLIFFSNHICCSSIALVWAPYDYTVASCYFNLIFFILYCILGEVQANETLKKVFYTIIVFTNLGLILAGCRGLVLQQSNITEQNCQQFL